MSLFLRKLWPLATDTNPINLQIRLGRGNFEKVRDRNLLYCIYWHAWLSQLIIMALIFSYMKFHHIITLGRCSLHAPAFNRLNISCPTWMLCHAAPMEFLFSCGPDMFKKSHTRLSSDTSKTSQAKNVYSVSFYWIRLVQEKKRLVRKTNRLFSYLRQSWQSQRCSSGPQRRTGRASRSECPQPPLSSFSTCTQSPPWGSHLNRREH